MSIIGYNESSLTTSEIFGGLNKVSDQKEKIVNIIKSAKQLSQEDIELAYIGVKNISDTLTKTSLKAFDAGKIVLIYNDVPSLSITQAIPFITFKRGNDYISYIFMDKFVTKNREGGINVQTVVLKDLLQSALISSKLKVNYSSMASNPYLQKTLMTLYTKFVVRILNREFSIGAEKIIIDSVQYWINRFFLENILGAINSLENIELLSKSHFKFIDEVKYEEIRREYNDAGLNQIGTLLELIKTASPRMESLALNTFVGNWINYYFIPSMLAIDNIEYLIYMILSLLSGTNVISINASEMVRNDKNIKGLKEELLKLI
jgi:hypothetical protein